MEIGLMERISHVVPMLISGCGIPARCHVRVRAGGRSGCLVSLAGAAVVAGLGRGAVPYWLSQDSRGGVLAAEGDDQQPERQDGEQQRGARHPPAAERGQGERGQCKQRQPSEARGEPEGGRAGGRGYRTRSQDAGGLGTPLVPVRGHVSLPRL